MLLLIIPENGGRLGTYGRDILNFGNMKYPLLCFVIVLTCSYCASADMDLYPESKYYGQNERSVYDEADVPLSNKGYDSGVEDYEDNTKTFPGADYDSRRSDEEDSGDSGRNSLDGILKFLYRKQNKGLDGADKRRGIFPRLPQQADPDGYEDEDSDGGFDQKWLNDEIERNTQRILQKWQETSRKKMLDHLQNSLYDDSSKTSKYESGEHTTREEPAHFAYVPPDPRYYEKQSETTTEAQPISSPIQQGSNTARPSDSNNSMKTIEAPLRRDHTYIEDASRSHYRQDLTLGRSAGDVVVQHKTLDSDSTGLYIIAIVAGISAAATVGLIAVGIGWYNLQKHVKNATDVDYPAYGVTGPNKDASPSNDRRLAQSAQMYHYQHQKQQIIAMEKAANGDRHGSVSDADTDEENEEGDYTVYECPGLAPTGEMEVKNPLYQDDPTPAQTPQIKHGNKE
ncbi:uncharacterized protein LOC123311412 isoform X2 [Coccinella septempunctata]|uniref:uncharacterized protein LOC123311412 isoform X2 n=1 Tax=Coccinella septempunctata TaxID=41139 RepID=UPI001D0717B9|nr:uncharacterized protein LOC123311412 isoform X2 [Coccinella septempunctata]